MDDSKYATLNQMLRKPTHGTFQRRKEREEVGEFHPNRHCKTTLKMYGHHMKPQELGLTVPCEIKLLLLNKCEDKWESLPNLISLLSELPICKGLMKDLSKLQRSTEIFPQQQCTFSCRTAQALQSHKFSNINSMEGGKVAKLRTNQCVVLKIKAYIVEQRKIQTKLLHFLV